MRDKPSRKERARRLAERCDNAYSFDRYESWWGVASALLRKGLDDRQAEAVMRSKWMRWAADASPRPYGRVPAKAIIEFLNGVTQEEIEQLTLETFGPPSESVARDH